MSQCDPARGMNGLELLRLIMACIAAAVIGHSPGSTNQMGAESKNTGAKNRNGDRVRKCSGVHG
jgi:hypothetical protein